MLLTVLDGNDKVERRDQCVIITFGGKRRVLSSGPANGGYQENLTHVFNNDGKDSDGGCKMKGRTYKEHMEAITREVGLPVETTAGVTTAASMENISIKTEEFWDLKVTALVTAGINTNGGRVGDYAIWYEKDGCPVNIETHQREQEKHGTIITMLHINVDLTPGAMARAMITATEAKTAAIQELLLPSRYSRGLATGSGTDSTAVIANSESSICFTNAGKHSKLGELIGRAVKAATKEALSLQSNQNPELQHNVIKRIERFGIFGETLWERINQDNPDCMTREEFAKRYERVVHNSKNITYTSLYVHLIDQLDWDLLSAEEVYPAAKTLLRHIGMHSTSLAEIPQDKEEAIQRMVDCLASGLIVKITKKL